MEGCFVEAGGASYASLDCLGPLFRQLVLYLILFSGIVALFMIIFSGIKMIMSSGDPKQLDTARKTFGWAILGLFIILLSFFIIKTISNVTNVPCIQFFGLSNCESSGISNGTENARVDTCTPAGGKCRANCLPTQNPEPSLTCPSGSDKCCTNF